MLLLVNAIAWTCLIVAPWGDLLLPGLVALSAAHLAAPLWASWRRQTFVSGPLLLFLSDAGFLYAAWTRESWGDLTVVFVPLFVGLAFLSLAYAAAMMALLARIRRSRR